MNILHLSDIHFGRNNPRYGIPDHFENHDRILSELIDELAKLPPDLRPKHIVFTGDIAWHGLKEEFDEALVWFRKLLSALELTGKDITFCVGNHDVDWAYKCIPDQLDDDMVTAIDDLYRYENIHRLEPAIRAYNEFCGALGVEPYTYPLNGERAYSYSVGYKDVTFDCGKTVRILGFNTSMLIGKGHISEDKMWLGKEQINSLLQYGIIPAPEDIWFTIALYHHSDRFLHPNETNTYEHRTAPLPTVVDHVDLLLCGHTESCGKPRLTQQRGGGQILLGGATYFSDDHVNAFSMLYLSEKKRSFGLIPYVYEGKWQDYDFLGAKEQIRHLPPLPPEGEVLKNVTVTVEKGFWNTRLPISRLERRGSKLTNKLDILNPLTLRCTGEVLELKLRRALARNLDSILLYQQFLDGMGDGEELTFTITGEDGQLLARGHRLALSPLPALDQDLKENLVKLEKIYGLHLDLPETVTKEDLDTVSRLLHMGEYGFDTIPEVPETVTATVDEAYLKRLSACLEAGDPVYLKAEYPRTVRLFNVDVRVGTLLVFTGEYTADREDVAYKLATCREGDLRRITFRKKEKALAFLVSDEEKFLQYIRLTAQQVFPITNQW